MAIGWLSRFASGAPVAVFVALGRDAVERVEDLCLNPRIERVASPRHADLLLVAGKIRSQDERALRTVHDQIPAPRVTLWWGSEPFEEMASPVVVPLSDDALPHLLRLRADRSDGESDLLPDEPPSPWRGVGPNGQGGEGMMGGVPFGRPMAMTHDDVRDGLQLDEVTVQIGPYLRSWPSGLVLEMSLQGDVVQRARIVRPPYGPTKGTQEGVTSRLLGAARLLDLLELGGLADRCRRAAFANNGRTMVDPALRTAVRRSGAFAALPPGLGVCLVGNAETDVRSRLHALIEDGVARAESETAEPKAKLSSLLRGLEWNEAMLVINSFTSHDLLGMTPCEKAESADSADSDEAQGEHASMEHQH